MNQKTLESVFKQINDSYNSLLELFNRENVEVEIKRIRDELIIATCGIYFNSNIKFDDITYNTETYSAEIIEKINECISSYPKSSSKQKGVPFSKYVCSSIKKMVSELNKHQSFEDRAGGQHISKDALALMNNVKDQDRVFEGFGVIDENRRNKKIAISIGISEEKVLEMKRLLRLKTIADKQNSESEESFSIIDIAGKHIDYSSADKELQKERLEIIFDCIQEEWEIKSNLELSDILTADILRLFKGKAPKRKSYEIEKPIVYSSSFCFDLEKFVDSYSFINKEIASRFFSDSDYELPSQVELAAKFGKTKSGINKQVSRFYEKVAQSEKLQNLKKVVNFYKA